MISKKEVRFYRKVWVQNRMIHDIAICAISIVGVFFCASKLDQSSDTVVLASFFAAFGYGICAIICLSIFDGNADYMKALRDEDEEAEKRIGDKLKLADKSLSVLFWASSLISGFVFIAMLAGW